MLKLGFSCWFVSCVFLLGICGICEKKKDDLYELFIIKKEDDVI